MSARGKGRDCPRFNILDDKCSRSYFLVWYKDDGKTQQKRYVRYGTNLTKEEAYSRALDYRYDLMTTWREKHLGMKCVGTMTDTIHPIVSNDILNIETNDMVMVLKKMRFDLLSFDPEWRDEDMDNLLEKVENPYDFKEILEKNSDKMLVKTYHTDNACYWDSNEIGRILDYSPNHIVNNLNAVGLKENIHFKRFGEIKDKIQTHNRLVGLRKDRMMLTQRGLMKFLIHSNKPIAKTFKTWIELVLMKISDISKTIIEDQERRLEKLEKNKDKVVAEMNRQRALIQMIKAEKTHHMYIFTTIYHKDKLLYKFGMTDTLKKRLTQLQNGDKCTGGYYLKTIPIYENKCSEKLLHRALDFFKLRHSGEWYRMSSDDKAIEVLEKMVDGVNEIYEAVSEVPQGLIDKLNESITDIGGEIEALPQIEAPPIILSKEELLKDYGKRLVEKIGITGLPSGETLKKIRELNKENEFSSIKKELPRSVSDLENKKDSLSLDLEMNISGSKKIIKLILEVVDSE